MFSIPGDVTSNNNVYKFTPAITGLHCISWAPSSEFVSSSIPSWQILTAYAQPFRRARDLAFCLKVPLDSLLVWASSGGSGETARMLRLAWTFAARIGDKHQIRLTRSIYLSRLWHEQRDLSVVRLVILGFKRTYAAIHCSGVRSPSPFLKLPLAPYIVCEEWRPRRDCMDAWLHGCAGLSEPSLFAFVYAFLMDWLICIYG